MTLQKDDHTDDIVKVVQASTIPENYGEMTSATTTTTETAVIENVSFGENSDIDNDYRYSMNCTPYKIYIF